MRQFRYWSLVQGLLGLTLGAVALTLALRRGESWQWIGILRHIHWPWYGLAWIAVLAVSAGKAWRWQVLYPASARPVPWRDHFAVLLIAQTLNMLIPVRLGEIARLGLMQQAHRSLGMTLGTIAAEKALDLITTGALLLVALPVLVWTDARWTALTVLGSGVFVVMVLIILGLTHAFWLRILARLPRPRDPRLAALEEQALRLPRALLEWAAQLSWQRWMVACLLSVGVWGVSILGIALVLWAFDFYSWLAALSLMLAITFTNLLPQPPALVGTVLFVTQEILVALGWSHDQGLAVGAALNLAMVMPIVAGGVWATMTRLARLPAGSLRHLWGLDILVRGRK